MNTKKVIFNSAHRIAKAAHVAGESYAVTFGAALRIVYAQMKIERVSCVCAGLNVLKGWTGDNAGSRYYPTNDTSGIRCASWFISGGEFVFVSLRGMTYEEAVKAAKSMLNTQKRAALAARK
jgi:hypothetical protein